MPQLISRFSPLVLAALLALTATRSAQAVDVFWNVGDSFWDISGSWSPAGPPTAADNARIDNGGIARIDGVSGASFGSYISVNGGSQLEITGSSLTVAGGFADPGTFQIGHDGGKGTLNLSNGSLNVSAASGGGDGRTTVGWGSTEDNQINHTGATGGVANFNDLWVGSGGGKGTLNTDGIGFNVVTFATGQGGGTGVTNQTGGSITSTGETHVGADAGSHGTYNLAAAATLTSNANFFVGRDGGTGVFNNDGVLTTQGENTVGWRGGANGTFNNHNGATVNSNGGFLAVGRDGGTGTFNNSGTVVANNQLAIGRWGGSNGTFINDISGTLTANGELNIGRDGSTGLLDNDNVVTVGGEFNVGRDGGNGTLINRWDTVANGEMFVGQGAGAVGLVDNRLNLTLHNYMNIGRDLGQGTFKNSGTLQVDQELRVGMWGGNGTFENTGSTNANGEIRVGMGANGNGQGVGKFTNSGTVTGNNLFVGRDGGVGEFINNSGSVTVNHLWVGQGLGDGNVAGNGTLTINGGDILSNTQDFLVGNNAGLSRSVGVVNQSGGTLHTNAGDGSWAKIGNDGGDGTYNMSGGTFTTHNRAVVGWGEQNGFASRGLVEHTGGAMNFNELWVGSGDNNNPNHGGNGVVNTIGTGFNVASNLGVGQGSGTGTMNQTGGTITVGGEVHIGADIASNGTYTLGDNFGAAARLVSTGNSAIGRDGAAWGQLNIQANSSFASNGENFVGWRGGANGVVYNSGDYSIQSTSNIGRDKGYGAFVNQLGGTMFVRDELRVGMWGGTGEFISDAGAGNVQVNGELRVGMGENGDGRGNGTFTANGGNITTNSWLSVGRDGGIGVFTQNNNTGSVNATNVQIGRAPGDGTLSGGQGTYNLQSGTLNISEGGDAGGPGRLSIGTDTFGSVNQGSGQFNMTGGRINMTGGGRTSIGWNGPGALDQSSGVANLNDVWIGSHDGGAPLAGQGLYRMSGDATLNANLMMLGRGGSGGGAGTFEVHNIASVTIGDRMSVGVEPGATGNYTQTGGIVNIANSVIVGEQSDVPRGPAVGHYVQTGGKTNIGRELRIAQNGSSGDYDQSGGKTTFGAAFGGTEDALVVGNGGSTGTVTISGGELTQLSAGVQGGWNRIGTGGGTGNFNLSGGSVNLIGRVHVGSGGGSTGTVNQTGGLFEQLGPVAGNDREIVLGDGDATGHYNISGGTLHTEGSMHVGHWSNSHGFLSVDEPNPLNPTTVSIDRTLSVARYTDGGDTTGQVTQWAGTVNAGELALASGRQTDGSVVGNTNIKGEYYLIGGALNVAGGTHIGRHGLGNFYHSGGTFTAHGDMAIAEEATSTGNYLLSGGTLDLDGHNITLGPGAASFSMTGGTLKAVNVFNTSLSVSSFSNPAIVAPGSTLQPVIVVPTDDGLTGKMFVQGDYSDDAGTTLQIQLGGAGSGEFDKLSVAGAATLTGVVDVSLERGYQPTTGSYFEIVTAGGGLLNFATITGTDLSGIGGPDYQLNKITDAAGTSLGLLAALPGDADLNMTTEFADLGILLNNYNAANAGGPGEWGLGDFNDDHITDFSDLGILLNNYNQSVSLAAGIDPVTAEASVVPEPSSWALLALGGLALGARRLRRRS